MGEHITKHICFGVGTKFIPLSTLDHVTPSFFALAPGLCNAHQLLTMEIQMYVTVHDHQHLPQVFTTNGYNN